MRVPPFRSKFRWSGHRAVVRMRPEGETPSRLPARCRRYNGHRTSSADHMSKVRFVGHVVLDSIAAVFGTTFLEYNLSRLLHSDTGGGFICRTWIASVLLAGFLGAVIARYGKPKTAVWAWVLPGLVFCGRTAVYMAMWRTGFVATFSGYECAVGLQRHDCQDFLEFTVPLIRGTSYSVGCVAVLADLDSSERG